MVAVLLLLLAVSTPPDGSAAANTPGTTSDFAKSIAAIEAKTGSRIGVAALDTGSGKRLHHGSEECFPMCSAFKLLADAAVLKRVDEKQDQLDRFVRLAQKTFWNTRPSRKPISKTAP